MAKHPAAFVNVIAEDGTKAEAVEWLQRTWDDYMDLRMAISDALRAFNSQDTISAVNILNRAIVGPAQTQETKP